MSAGRVAMTSTSAPVGRVKMAERALTRSAVTGKRVDDNVLFQSHFTCASRFIFQRANNAETTLKRGNSLL